MFHCTDHRQRCKHLICGPWWKKFGRPSLCSYHSQRSHMLVLCISSFEESSSRSTWIRVTSQSDSHLPVLSRSPCCVFSRWLSGDINLRNAIQKCLCKQQWCHITVYWSAVKQFITIRTTTEPQEVAGPLAEKVARVVYLTTDDFFYK